LESAKKCVITYLPNELVPKINDAKVNNKLILYFYLNIYIYNK